MAYFFITVITIIIIVIITITIIVTMMMTMAPGLVWNFGEAELSGSSVKLKLKELDRRERCLHHHDGEDGDDDEDGDDHEVSLLLVCHNIIISQVVKMMMGVVSLFLVCWLPYHTYFITANVYPAINYTHYIQVYIIVITVKSTTTNTIIIIIIIIIVVIIIQDIYLSIYWLAMSNSMYNPMIYCYMNQR